MADDALRKSVQDAADKVAGWSEAKRHAAYVTCDADILPQSPAVPERWRRLYEANTECQRTLQIIEELGQAEAFLAACQNQLSELGPDFAEEVKQHAACREKLAEAEASREDVLDALSKKIAELEQQLAAAEVKVWNEAIEAAIKQFYGDWWEKFTHPAEAIRALRREESR